MTHKTRPPECDEHPGGEHEPDSNSSADESTTVKSSISQQAEAARPIPTVPGKTARPLDVTFFEPYQKRDDPEGKYTQGTRGIPKTHPSFDALAEEIAGLVASNVTEWCDYDDEQGAKAARTLTAKMLAAGQQPRPEQLEHATRVGRVDAAKARMLAFSCVTFTDNYRKKTNVEHCSAYAGDFDELTAEQWAGTRAKLEASGVAYLAYGSPKDGIPKKLETPEVSVKRRLLLPLSRDVTPAEDEKLQRIVPHLLGLKGDPQAFDASRLFYVGTIGDSTPAVECSDGEALDVDAALKVVVPEAAKPGKKTKAPKAATVTTGGRYSNVSPAAERISPCPPGVKPYVHGLRLCETLAPAIAGENGSAALMRVARALRWGLKLEADECQDAIVSVYNDRCEPPWSDAEIAHKIENAGLEAGAPYAAGALLPAEGVATAAGTSPLLLSRDGRCYVRRDDSNAYDLPLAKCDLGMRLANLGLADAYDLPRQRDSINVTATLEKFGRVPMHLERDFCATGITWDQSRETLIEGYELPSIEPVHDAAVEAWLAALSGGALGELYDWIAGCRQDRLKQPGAALGLLGDPDLGKTLLACGLSLLWGHRIPVKLGAIVKQFNAVKAQSPIWFDDECEAIKSGDVSSDDFRQLLQAREHYYEPKHLEQRRLGGCARVILACNEPSDIQFSNVAGPSAVQAIVDRLALFVVPVNQTPVVRAALDRLRKSGEQDVDLDRVTRHLSWVQANVVPRVQRFLGSRSDVSAATRAAYAGTVSTAPALFDLIREYLTGGGESDATYAAGGASAYRLATTGKDAWDLLALPSALVAHLAVSGVRTDLGAVQKALGAFKRGERVQVRFGGFKAHFWALDTGALCEALGLSAAEQESAIRTVSERTADRLPAARQAGHGVAKLRAVKP